MSRYAFNIDTYTHEDADPLFPVKLNGKWGYINIDGKLKIKPRFDYAEDFHEEFAVVRMKVKSKTDSDIYQGMRNSFSDKLKLSGCSYKFGFIDKSGNYVCEPIYDYADGFSESRALVRIGNSETGEYGYIDTSGDEIIKPQFLYNGFTKDDLNFNDGLAPVKIKNWIAYINDSGNIEFCTDFDHGWQFSDGLALVRKGNLDKGLYGYVDKKGNVVIEPKFNLAHSFSDGFAGVMIEDWTKGMFSYIDKTGEIRIPSKYRRVSPFFDGLAWAWKGDLVVAFLALISMHPFEPYISGTWELIDKSGMALLTVRNGWVGSFNGNHALRKLGNQYFFIDRNGKECFDKTFNFARAFKNDLAMVRVEGKQGYINRNGNYVWFPSV